MASPQAFIDHPSEELLSGLTKPQLCDLVTHYDLVVTSHDKNLKETLFLAVRNQLKTKGILNGDDSEKLQLEKLLAEKEVRLSREKELEQSRTLELRKLEHDLEIKRLEYETREREREHALAMKRLELELSQLPQPSPASPPIRGFDVSKNIRLVPPFSEKEVDIYFTHFERVATTLNWPRDMWPLLLQCVFTGKAQEVFSALSMDQAKQYDVVRDSILHAYELVPEAYRQKFRNARKLEQRTFVEFAREKERLFDRWCTAQNVQTRDDLRQLILLEDFKNCLPEAVAVYLNEQEVQNLDKAAVLADRFVLTHKRVSSSGWVSHQNKTRHPPKSKPQSVGGNDALHSSPPVNSSHPPTNTEITCHYCKKVGHLKYDCAELRKKKEKEKAKSFGLVASCGSISFILGNDLAGGKVWGNTEAVSPPVVSDFVPEIPPKPDQCSRRHPEVFPSCAVTRAMVKRGLDCDLVSLEDTFLTGPDVAGSSFSQSPVGELERTTANFDDSTGGGENSGVEIESVKVVPPLGVIDASQGKPEDKSSYFVQDGLLCRRKAGRVAADQSERVCFVGHTRAGSPATECGEEPQESRTVPLPVPRLPACQLACSPTSPVYFAIPFLH
ncbi:hypothetical protein N1851_006690 [Merluccius polli]|uniref:SCAN box domain-containing protein n=1 Tax=Merluccius polli TaxID=89951 RepID=A0AA47N589_MERPO|nr:hypothetical protein N1851_006690 [Merluccius polli]